MPVLESALAVQEAVRRLVAVAASDLHLFAIRIRQNVQLVRPAADDAEVVEFPAGQRARDRAGPSTLGGKEAATVRPERKSSLDSRPV